MIKRSFFKTFIYIFFSLLLSFLFASNNELTGFVIKENNFYSFSSSFFLIIGFLIGLFFALTTVFIYNEIKK